MNTPPLSFLCLRGLVLLLLTAMAPNLAPAQAPTNPAGAETQRAIAYRIATNDRIRVGVFQEPDLDIIARVDMKGTVNLPLLGQIKVQNYTISEAEKTIETAYRDGRFLRNPQVTITVEEYAPREVSIQGQVRNPARYTLPIEQPMTVLELVTRAGGFTDTARGTAVSVTRIKEDGTKEVFTVDVESLIKGKNRARAGDNSLILLPGDIVYVPERLI